MPLVILTRSPDARLFSTENWKRSARRLLKKNRGPQAVTASMLRGLNKANCKYRLDPGAQDIGPTDTIWVNESIEALRWAIAFKKENAGVKLVVGPNLVVTPADHQGIILDDAIDIILQPSEWTKKLYETYDRAVGAKIKIWPAGVADPYERGPLPKKEDYIVVYQKNAPQDLFDVVVAALEEKDVPFRLVRYGSFDHGYFLSLLDKARGMIQLSSSESQGIALQEGWIRNVPALAWDRGFWEHEGRRFEFSRISCPYLTPGSGMTFKGKDDLKERLDEFLRRLPDFKARNYSMTNLTDEVTTRAYFDIIDG